MTYELSGRVTYVLPGAIAELLFDNEIRKPTVGFSERGELVGGGSVRTRVRAAHDRSVIRCVFWVSGAACAWAVMVCA